MPKNKLVVLLTDFGTSDGYVGAMRGAIMSVAPECKILDITHEVPQHDVFQGAYLLDFAHGSFPGGTVFCVVVDPGVGTERKAIVVSAGDYLFVGPDNGVLWPAASSTGGAKAYDLPTPKDASATFHGRDLFAPTAAKLASGQLKIEELKPLTNWKSLDFGVLNELPDGSFAGAILSVDIFGNVVSNFSKANWGTKLSTNSFELSVGPVKTSRLLRCYDEAKDNELFCLWGSGGLLELSLCQDSAAKHIGLKRRKEWPEVILRFS